MKRDGCVRGQLGRDEVRVRGEGRGLHPARNDGVEAPPNAQEAALAQVVREEVRPGPGGGLVPDRPEVASGEDGCAAKKSSGFTCAYGAKDTIKLVLSVQYRK